jgi:uncharacterized protein YciI
MCRFIPTPMLILLGVCSLTANAQTSPADQWFSLYALVDDWVLVSNQQATGTVRSWQRPNDSTITGITYTIFAGRGDTTVWDSMVFTFRESGINLRTYALSEPAEGIRELQLSEADDTHWSLRHTDEAQPMSLLFSLSGMDTLEERWTYGGTAYPLQFVRKPRIQRFEMSGETGTTVMRKFWLLSYLSGSNRTQDSQTAQQIQQGHMAHLGKLYRTGKSCVAGPTDGEGEVRGFIVFTVGTREEAIYLARQDPAVQAARLTFTLEPWWAMEGAVLR